MKLAIACAVLLLSFPRSASAADGRRSSTAPAPMSAATSAPASASASEPASPAADAPAALPAAATLPAAPSAVITLNAPRPHRFFDVRNSLGLAALAATLSADALSTQKGLAYPGFREMNPIARPFVQTRAGAAAYSAGSFALLAGTMYVAHRTRRHKLERILPFAFAGWEGWLSARNYRVIAKNRR